MRLLIFFLFCFSVYSAETRADKATAMRELIQKSENGDIESQFLLGAALLSSRPDQAEKWLIKASENEHEAAQLYLGLQYYTGDHLPKNSVLSAKWFGKAAEQNNAKAQYWLALHYAAGEGVKQKHNQSC